MRSASVSHPHSLLDHSMSVNSAIPLAAHGSRNPFTGSVHSAEETASGAGSYHRANTAAPAGAAATASVAGEAPGATLSVHERAEKVRNANSKASKSQMEQQGFWHTLARQWDLLYLLLFLACVVVAIVLLAVDVADLRRRNRNTELGDLAFITSKATAGVTTECVTTAAARLNQEFVRIDETGVLQPLLRQLEKVSARLRRSYMGRVKEAANALIDPADCNVAIGLLSGVFFDVSAEYMEGVNKARNQRSMGSAFANLWFFARSKLLSEGILDVQVSTPAEFYRAATWGMGNDLNCLPMVSTFRDRLLHDYDLSTLQCPTQAYEATMPDLLGTVNDATKASIQEAVDAYNRIRIDAMFQEQVPFSTRSHILHIVLYSVIIVVGVASMVLLLLMRQRDHRRQWELRIFERDFKRNANGVQLTEETLRCIDYYSWRMSGMEPVDAGHVVETIETAMECPISTRASVHLGSPNPLSLPYVPSAEPQPMGASLATAAGPAPAHGPESSMVAAAAAAEKSSRHRSVASVDPHDASFRIPTIQTLAGERRRAVLQLLEAQPALRDATQVHLRLHSAVAPMVLLRPFIPDTMSRDFAPTERPYSADDFAHMGPSMGVKRTALALQDGLEPDPTVAYLFLSLQALNAAETMDEAINCYAAGGQGRPQGNSSISHQPVFGSGGGNNSGRSSRRSSLPGSNPGRAATDVLIVQAGDAPPRAPVSISGSLTDAAALLETARLRQTQIHPLDAGAHSIVMERNGRYEAAPQDEEMVATRDSFPLSSLAAAANFIFRTARDGAAPFHGAVVQVTGDGVLLQFRVGSTAEEQGHTFSDWEDPEEQARLALHDDNHVTINGKTFVLTPTERAARAALAIRQRIYHYLEFTDDNVIPARLLQLPMVVYTPREEEGSYHGRTRFHISRGYSVLSPGLPLLFPLADLCEQYNCDVILSDGAARALDKADEDLANTQPVHYLHDIDVNSYHYKTVRQTLLMQPTTTVVTVVTGTDGKASLKSLESMAGVGNDLPSPMAGGGAVAVAGADDGAAAPAALNSPSGRRTSGSSDGADGGLGGAVRSAVGFRTSCTCYALRRLRPVDPQDDAYRQYMQESTRERSRREQWRQVWRHYEALQARLAVTGGLRDHALNVRQQRQAAARVRTLAAAQGEGQGAGGASAVNMSRNEWAASKVSSTDEFSDEAAPTVSPIQLFLRDLSACYQELQSYRQLHGIAPEEKAVVLKIRKQLMSMLLAYGVMEIDDDPLE